MKYLSRNAILSVLFSSTLILSSCGGGGGGGNNTTPTSNQNTNTSSSVQSSSLAALTANPGTDLTVNAGETINLDPHVTVVGANSFSAGSGNLEIKGSSTNNADIVDIKWTLVSGTVGSLTTKDTTSGKASFVAPQTGTAASVQIVYKLTIKNAAGAVGEANVTFTVNRVNQAPTVDAGKDQTTKGKSFTLVTGFASDKDGTIATYLWTQVSGPAVTLTNANTSSISFTAPSTATNQDITLQLEATDNDGAKSSDQVVVHITPENAPDISVNFPTNGIYRGTDFSANGFVTSPNSATITSVTVDTGSGAVAATLDAKNHWHVGGLALPSSASFPITITATDANGLMSTETMTVSTSGSSLGTGSTWKQTKLIFVDNVLNNLYLMTTGATTGDVRLMEVNTFTGNRKDISWWADTTQGDSSTPVSGMTANGNNIYASINPKSGTKAVMKIDSTFGMRSLISGGNNGSGPVFTSIFQMAYCNSKLYVSDNGGDALFQVDTFFGTRKVVVDKNSLNYSVTAPDSVVCGSSTFELILAPYYSGKMFFWSVNTSGSTATTNIFSDSDPNTQVGTGPAINGPIKGMSYDQSSGGYKNLFVVDANGNIFLIDTTNGNRQQFGSVGASPVSVAFIDSMLYIADVDTDTKPYVAAVDIYTGNKVIISK